MGRGPGRIERAIEALFEAEPSRTFSTEELVEAVYHGVTRVEKKHRVAVLRAADKVIGRRKHWAKWQCERWGSPSVLGRGAIYVNLIDLRSYAFGRLRADILPGGSIEELTARLDGGKEAELIAPGGAWWLHVEAAKGKFGAIIDPETQKMIDAQRKSFEQFEVPEAMAGSPKEREERRRRMEANEHGCICGRCGKAFGPDEPVARCEVPTKGFGLGHGATMVVTCLACTDTSSGYYRCDKCQGCGRQVYQRPRRNRRHCFCSEDCQRHGKNARRRVGCLPG